jgi:hypothetical protein
MVVILSSSKPRQQKVDRSRSLEDATRKTVFYVVISKQHSGSTFFSKKLNVMPGVESAHEVLIPGHQYCSNNGETPFDKMAMVWGIKPWVNNADSKYLTSDGGSRDVASAHDLRSRMSCIGKGAFPLKYFGKEWPLSDKDWDYMIEHHYEDMYRTYVSELKAIGFLLPTPQLTFDRSAYDFFVKNDVRVFILERKNIIAHLIALPGVRASLKTSLRHVTEDELSTAADYLSLLNTIKNRTVESCIPTMEITYEYYMSNFSSFIDVFKFVGLSGTYAAMDGSSKGINGNTTIKYEYDTGESGSVSLNTESKHHKNVTSDYIVNKRDVLEFIDKNFHGQECMLSDDCPVERPRVYSSTECIPLKTNS